MIKDQRERESEKQKKPYVKPEIKQVQLKPEEAVLGACKTGPVAPGFSTPFCSACASFWGS